MFTLEEGSQISIYVEQAVLSWVRLHPHFEQTLELSSLCDGHFLLQLLLKLPNFKLVSPLIQSSENVTLAAKVGIMKNIAKSLIAFHQTQLLRDVSEMDINYVQLCMGNRKQLFRLITLVFSALWGSASSRQALQEQIAKLGEEQAQIMRIIIDNSVNLGQECGSCSSRSWRLSEQKKVFAKMEILQNKIQELEIINKNLYQSLKCQKQWEETAKLENKKLQDEIMKLLLIHDELCESRDRAISELRISNIEQTTSKKKIQVVKARLQEKISKLQIQLERLEASSQECKLLKQKLDGVSEINKQVKEQNALLRQKLMKLEKQREVLKKTQQVNSQQFRELKQHCGELEVKIQELLLACSLKSDSEDRSYKKSKLEEKAEDQDGAEMNKYRVKDNLGWLNNGSWSNQLEIRTITERSSEDSVCLDHLKQNQSIFINCSGVIQQDQKERQTRCKNPNSEGEENRSHDRQYLEEIKLLTCIIVDLKAQLDEANKRNPIIGNSWGNASRMHKFKTKVRQMFDEKITFYQPV